MLLKVKKLFLTWEKINRLFRYIFLNPPPPFPEIKWSAPNSFLANSSVMCLERVSTQPLQTTIYMGLYDPFFKTRNLLKSFLISPLCLSAYTILCIYI